MRALVFRAAFFSAGLMMAAPFHPCVAQDRGGEEDAILPGLVANPYNLPGGELEDIRSLDVYVENNKTLHLLLAGIRKGHAEPAVYYTHSADGGYSWSTLIEVRAGNGPPTESKRGNDLQIAATGKQVVAIWQTTGQFPGNGVLVSALSSDRGEHWEPGPNPSDDETPSDHGYMDLLVDDLGDFHLVWFDDREETGSYNGLRYTKSNDEGRHWQPNLTLDDKTCTCCWGRIVQDPNGTALNVLYRDADPRDMAMARSETRGNQWRRMGPVGAFQWEFIGCPHNGGGLAVTRHGDQLVFHSVVWTGSERQPGLYYLRSMDYGRSWNHLSRLGGESALHGDIAAGTNRVVAVWDAIGADGSTIFTAHSPDGGQSWTEARRLSTPGASGTHPRVVATASGFMVFWTERRVDAFLRLAMAVVGNTGP